MKQEISRKALFAVIVAGGVIFAGMAMTGCRDSSATAGDAVAASADGAGTAAPQTRREQGKAMAEEMRSQARGRQRER